MASSFANDIRHQLKHSSTLDRLLIANIAVYLLITIANNLLHLYRMSMQDYSGITTWLALPASVDLLVRHPWTLITYMFLHLEFFHILFNMLWLFWMGRLLQEYVGGKKLFSTYIFGGICGAILYIISFNVFPLFTDTVHYSFALGASASVLAITAAAATLLPDYPVNIFIARVPLKFIAVIIVLIDLTSVSGENAGGHIAHLGGALYGFVYIRQLRKGNDIARWFNNLVDRAAGMFKSSRRSGMKVKYRRSADDDTYNQTKKERQERTDEILEKISKSGYGSLTQEEKDFLFRSSREN